MPNTVKLILAGTALAALGACSVNTAPPPAPASPSPVVVAPTPAPSATVTTPGSTVVVPRAY